jgi:deoxycytidylate deaminase
MINYDWSEIVFQSKSELKDKDYIFIAGSREISKKRLVQIIKEYLPNGNLLIGILKSEYIDGFEGQPQFRSMNKEVIESVLKKIAAAKLPNTVDALEYSQQDLNFILEKLKPKRAVFINGSWKRMFHLREEFYTLSKHGIKHDLISPFVDEEEAIEYYSNFKILNSKSQIFDTEVSYSDQEIFNILDKEAAQSFATDFQTSCALVQKGHIKIIAHNEVVPYETYAMHFGSVKEKNFSPSNDLNHFDTNHAEMVTLLKSIHNQVNIKECSLYINLMPCPTCARILSKSGITEVIYMHDHSEGYAAKLFEKSGIKVRRFIGK